MTNTDFQVKQHFDHISGMYYDIVLGTPFLYGYYHVKEFDVLISLFNHFSHSEFVGGERPAFILDVGCATGRILREIESQSNKTRLVGVDISVKMISLARISCSQQTDLLVADIRNLPIRAEVFDFVYSLEVLEHLDNKSQSIPKAIREIVRVARPNGRVTVESPSPSHFRVQSLLQRIFRLHRSIFIESTITKFTTSYYPVPVAGPSSVQVVIDLLESVGAALDRTFWIRVIPEQSFVLIRNHFARVFLRSVDELASRLPIVKYFGREYIVSTRRRELEKIDEKREAKMR